jgi:DNA-binding NtrC family response regulator
MSALPALDAVPAPRSATVLLVEDDVVTRLSFADYLSENGMAALEAGTAEEAIALLASREDIDFVLSDIRMPGQTDGLDLFEWIGAHRPGLPVLIASGNPRGKESAANLFWRTPLVDKPYDYAEVLARIRAALEKVKPANSE